MLIIRKEQFIVFKNHIESKFIDRIIEHLKTNFQNINIKLPYNINKIKEVSYNQLYNMVRDGIQRARNYGLTYQSSIACFIVLMFIVSPNFDQQSSIRKILENQNIPADNRIDHLLKATSEDDWKEARGNYNKNSWNLN